MLFSNKNAADKRADLRAAMRGDEILQVPGAFSPLAAMEIEKHGFPAVYISGAVLASDLGLPDVGLTTLSEVAGRGQQIARVTDLPCIIDADTGFGEPMAVARTVRTLEEAGLAGCHIEDQILPKRCGHLDHKAVVETEVMVRKIRAAVAARRDQNFLIIARCDARSVEGLDAAARRVQAYAEAGADVIFPEALTDLDEFSQIRGASEKPMLANMTEFGKSDLFTATELQEAGYDIVIYPVTLWRLAMGAAVDGLREIKRNGSQQALLGRMQHRRELYDTLRYADYQAFDQDIYNFEV
jgi:methylisocitrate lyase